MSGPPRNTVAAADVAGRGWRKLHLGVDQSGVIRVHTLTEETGDDATTALDLLTAVEGPLVRVTADAAYDTVAVYETAGARGATVVIPPARPANVSGHGPRSPARDQTIMLVKQLGRRRWKKASGYHRQGRVENTFFAVDPDYSENRHIWIYYTTPRSPYRNRLSRFRHVGRQLVNETVMLESPVLGSQIHNGGCLRFASDKTLFVSTGDDRQGNSTAQDTHDLRGKILHINRDGSPAAGNPYLDGEKGDPRVWAYGFRNPWRFNLQPESENLFIGDVGEGRWEELNLGFRGGNFGWQLTEGPDPPGVPGVRYPIYSYPHTSPLGHAITGGDHARANNFPEEYKGNYFFGDSSTNELFRMVLGETNAPVLTEVFASEALRPVDIQFGPDGALYYVSFNGSVVRISYVGGTNRQPTALARVTPDNGEAPLTVSFDASGSTDADGDALTFRWDLGNGEQSSESILQRTYPPGVYNVSLTVTDSGGLSSSVQTSRVVSGNARPSAITQEPAHGRLYDDGEVIAFSGTGIDPEEGLIPCERLTWTVILHHLGHTHPFLGPLSGTCEGSFQVEPHGESHTFYEIRLSVDDTGASLGESGILTGVASVRIYPRLGWGSSR